MQNIPNLQLIPNKQNYKKEGKKKEKRKVFTKTRAKTSNWATDEIKGIISKSV
jgi:hypothetical protein